MKHGFHTTDQYLLLTSHWESVPHECSVPGCPGNRNRQKLELFDEMYEALELALPNMKRLVGPSDETRAVERVTAKAKELKGENQ